MMAVAVRNAARVVRVAELMAVVVRNAARVVRVLA